MSSEDAQASGSATLPTPTVVLAPQKLRRARPAAPTPVDADASAGGESTDPPKHGLAHDWALWGLVSVPAVRGKKPMQQNAMIFEFNTVEDFWSIYNSLLLPSQISTKTNIIFLRKGVKPEWEDPFNEAGGEWLAEFHPPSPAAVKRIDDVWEQTVLAVMGGTLGEDADDIAGVWLQVRPRNDRSTAIMKIALWNRATSKAEALGQAWVQHLRKTTTFPEVGCKYVANAEAVKTCAEQARTKVYTKEAAVMFAMNGGAKNNK